MNQQEIPNDTDLVSGVYEGGLKIWDCSLDLVNYLAKNPMIANGKYVLELGCGQGLPGIAAKVFCGAAGLAVQDYNNEVLERATSKVLELNLCRENTILLAGSWQSLMEKDGLCQQFDLILMSETLYNVEYYDSLLNFIDLCLSKQKHSQVLIGTKTFYYGLGGGYYEFQKYLETQWKGKFKLEIVQKINDMKSIERLILSMRRATEEELISQGLETQINIEQHNKQEDEGFNNDIICSDCIEAHQDHQDKIEKGDIQKLQVLCDNILDNFSKIRSTIDANLDILQQKESLNTQDLKDIMVVADFYQKTITQELEEEQLKKKIKTQIKSFFPSYKSKDPIFTASADKLDSLLITTPDQQQLLKSWIGYDCTMKLLFRGTKHGFKTQKFHFLCDNKGPSVVIFKSQNGFIFGAYSALKQHQPPTYHPSFEKDPTAFLFQLYPRKVKLEQNGQFEKCVSRSQVAFAVFGRTALHEDSSDLEIYEECNTKAQNFSNLGHAYQLPEGIVHGTSEAKNFLAGSYKFKVNEVEVFSVKKIQQK